MAASVWPSHTLEEESGSWLVSATENKIFYNFCRLCLSQSDQSFLTLLFIFHESVSLLSVIITICKSEHFKHTLGFPQLQVPHPWQRHREQFFRVVISVTSTTAARQYLKNMRKYFGSLPCWHQWPNLTFNNIPNFEYLQNISKKIITRGPWETPSWITIGKNLMTLYCTFTLPIRCQ